MSELNKLFNDMESSTVQTDGVVFYPVNESVGCRTQFTLLKWKPYHTIDFIIEQNNKDKTDLITWNKDREIVYHELDYIDYKHRAIIEFNVYVDNNDNIIYKPLMERVDKSTGNSNFTIAKTMINIKENIQKEELINEFN